MPDALLDRVSMREALMAASVLRQRAARVRRKGDRGLWSDADHVAVSTADAFARIAEWIEEAARNA